MTGEMSQTLAMLAQDKSAFSRDQRIICEIGASTDHIIEEIQSAVLPTHLHFLCGDRKLDVLVSNRRVIEFAKPHKDPYTKEKFEQQSAFETSKGAANDLAKAIQRLTDRAESLKVAARPCEKDKPHSETRLRISPEQLRKEIDQSRAGIGTEENSLIDFAKSARKDSVAQIVMRDGRVLHTYGSIKSISALKELCLNQNATVSQSSYGSKNDVNFDVCSHSDESSNLIFRNSDTELLVTVKDQSLQSLKQKYFKMLKATEVNSI